MYAEQEFKASPEADQELKSSPAPLKSSAYQSTPQIATGYPLPPQNPTAPPYAGAQYVHQQNIYPQQVVDHSIEWSSRICDCGHDVTSCCLTCCCPCITFGRIAEILDEGSPTCAVSGGIYAVLLLLTGCACCYSCCYRTKIRARFNLAETPCRGFLLHCFCGSCALCQEYRELKHRGYDPTFGWKANLQKQQQQQGMGMATPVGQTMSRS